MLKRVIVLLVLIGSLFPSVTQATEGGVVINSFQIAGEGANDEYVEIINNGSEPVNLLGWQLRKISLSGVVSNLLTTFPELRLGPGETLIISHPDFKGTADLFYSSKSYYLAPDSAIVLCGPKDESGSRDQVDLVGYGKSSFREGEPVSAPKDKEIYSRKNNGQDTNNNREDFYLSYAPPEEPTTDEPTEEENAPITAVNQSVNIRVNEFMPNPEGTDGDGEWIEIYNVGSDADISGYYIGDLVGSPKKYKFPKGTSIKKGQYLAFYASKTPISLNNDDEAVQFLSPDGKALSKSTNSGKGPEGASFAFDGAGWSWTSRPTPGAVNIIEKINPESSKEEKEVLALVDENSLPKQPEGNISQTERNNDRLLGYSLIVLAIVGAISYTLYIKKEKLREYYHRFREKNDRPWSKIWPRIKGR